MPLALSACKSSLGHAETGAGAVGMLRAVHALQRHSPHEVLHLRAVNPYVASTLALAKDALTGAASQGWSAPRQPGPLTTAAATSSADQPCCSGVSAFAFQGTNAHVTLASAPAAADRAAVAALALPWERRRFWYLPEPHALLARALGWGGEPGTVALELQLSRPRLAHLTDHQARRGLLCISTHSVVGAVSARRCTCSSSAVWVHCSRPPSGRPGVAPSASARSPSWHAH